MTQYREIIQEASRLHIWHTWVDWAGAEKKVVKEETPFAKLVVKVRPRICAKCGKAEYIAKTGGYVADAVWELKEESFR